MELAERSLDRAKPCAPAIFALVAAALYALVFSSVRPLGEWPLALVCFACATATVANMRQMGGLMPLFLFASLLLTLSLLRLMPPSWTLYYEPGAALRQWAWLPILLIVYPAVVGGLARMRQQVIMHAFSLFIASLIISRLSRFLGEGEWNYKTQIYVLNNENATTLIFFTIWVFYRVRSLPLFLFSCGAMMVFCNSSQSVLFMISLVACRLFPFYRTLPIMLLGAAVIGSVLSVILLGNLLPLDPNIAIRALFWRDVLRSVVDTFGVGVGFGTEWISNNYSDIRNDGWRLRSEDDEDRLLVATHSTLFDILFRLGVMGLLLFMLFLGRQLSRVRNLVRGGPDSRSATAMMCMVLWINTVNSGMTSINFLFGSLLALAWAEVCLRKADIVPPRSLLDGRPQKPSRL
ncbi:hypothetical protein [Devosia sp. RR2S18]|uniref:hypothetical protein n=1 Tax=Devosia rhizosphaerae TaxID=3049774 RepID=UPI002540CDE2|nr:hypothetical protein [Devosia sp. RR2S18]WIJ23908.1 hypothetical protein QOV41_12725 [Devosia sp. RR2S18]